MRVEPHEIGSIMHVVKRGARGMKITQDEPDKWRFVRMLYLLNDNYYPANRRFDGGESSSLHVVTGQTCDDQAFHRPDEWPERKPLVALLAWTLMPNHFHFLLEEITDRGIAKFMQRFCGSMTMHFNAKYKESGSIFQGAYKARTVDTNEDLQYVLPYIVVKNVLELYPGGLKKAIREFDHAWNWAKTYPFSSFQTTVLDKDSPIIDKKHLKKLDIPNNHFKKQAYSMLLGYIERRGTRDLLLEKR